MAFPQNTGDKVRICDAENAGAYPKTVVSDTLREYISNERKRRKGGRVGTDIWR